MSYKKILVIDDDPNTHSALHDVFAGPDFQVQDAQTAADGLRRTRDFFPDLILLDVMMPSGGGLDIYAGLKRLCQHVLIYSSAPSFLIEGKVPGLTKTDVVSKGLKPDELMALVRQRLSPPPKQ